MSDYTGMSGYYDLIMTSGYYDYGAIVDHLARHDQARSVLEVGAGTGLILEQLVARRPELEIVGVDLTRAMLDIAVERLRPYPNVSMHLQDVVSLSLDRSFDLAFSYGGVWYFVPDGPGYTMISHIRDERDNQRGLERLAAHLPSGGTLLLGVQSPHADYTRPVADGLDYSQRITPIEDGFRKEYTLTDRGRTVMEQTTDYRTYTHDDAMELLGKCGFEYRDAQDGGVLDGRARDGGTRDGRPRDGEPPLFLEFAAR